VLLHDADGATALELRDFAIAQLVPFKVPSSVVLVTELPRTASGKVNRSELARSLHDALRADYVLPRDREEALVAAAFAEVLEVPQVGALDHFFHAGGDSLRGGRVIARLVADTGVDLDIRALFEAPTVEQLAGRVRAAAGTQLPGSGIAPVRPLRDVAD
jgi:hypothetical protein